MIRLAIFDCDGTLVDGHASICEAMEAAFGAADLPPPDRSDIRRIVGLSLPQALRILAPGSSALQQEQALEAYKASFRASRNDGRLEEPLFEDIAGLIARLESAGWMLGVATGKSDRGLRACLEGHGLLGHFATLQTADHHPSKPDPAMLHAALAEAGAEPRNAVMIGDTSFDIHMAQAAGVRAIGVAWGYHEPQELHEAGADAVAKTVAELEEMILGQ